jgi:D-alanyl-lipoteichoic acid acyltransferase DltB (MBOAT superfamily)
MGLGGLWHGANWTFVLWGFWHGFGIAFVHLLRGVRFAPSRFKLPRWLKVLATFHFVCVGFVLFRAPDLATAWRVIAGPFAAPVGDIAAFVSVHVFQLILLAAFFATHPWDTHRNMRQFVRRLPAAAYWIGILVIWLFTLAISDPSRKFLYFDF